MVAMTEARELKGRYAAPALEKAFEVIELLATCERGLLVSEMAAHLDRSIGELFRIVVVMEKAGYLEKSPLDDRYSATYKFFDIGLRATPARNMTAAAVPEMQALSSAIHQSCHLVVARGGEGLVIAREENPGTRGFSLRLGAAVDIVQSCSGQVILAFSPPTAAARMIGRAEALRGAAIDRACLAERLDRIRSNGFAMRESPLTRGVTDISYPVFGYSGSIMAALTIPYLALIEPSQQPSIDEARRLLAIASRNISRSMGHTIPNTD